MLRRIANAPYINAIKKSIQFEYSEVPKLNYITCETFATAKISGDIKMEFYNKIDWFNIAQIQRDIEIINKELGFDPNVIIFRQYNKDLFSLNKKMNGGKQIQVIPLDVFKKELENEFHRIIHNIAFAGTMGIGICIIVEVFSKY